MTINLKRSEVEAEFHNIFGKTDGFGSRYSKQDIDNWINELVEDEATIGNTIIINA